MNLNQSRVQPKKLFEPANREELLRGWLLHAHKGRGRHDFAARRNDTYRDQKRHCSFVDTVLY